MFGNVQRTAHWDALPTDRTLFSCFATVHINEKVGFHLLTAYIEKLDLGCAYLPDQNWPPQIRLLCSNEENLSHPVLDPVAKYGVLYPVQGQLEAQLTELQNDCTSFQTFYQLENFNKTQKNVLSAQVPVCSFKPWAFHSSRSSFKIQSEVNVLPLFVQCK